MNENINISDLLVAMLFQQASQELNKREVNYHINKAMNKINLVEIFGKGSKPIPLICIETGERFPSFKDCSEKLDIPSSQISSAIKRRGTVHGYTLKKDVQNG